MTAFQQAAFTPQTYAADQPDVSMRATAGQTTGGIERRRPVLVGLCANGNGTFSLILRRIIPGGVNEDIRAFQSNSEGEMEIGPQGPEKGYSNWPLPGETLGFSLTLGTASTVTVEGDTGTTS